MILTLSNLPKTVKKNKRVGRGGKYGKNSGKGNKGQNKRSGKRPIGFQGTKSILRQVPKIGGFKALQDKQLAVVTLSFLDKHFADGQNISLQDFKPYFGPYLKQVRVIKTGQTSKNFVFDSDVYLTAGVREYFKL